MIIFFSEGGGDYLESLLEQLPPLPNSTRCRYCSTKHYSTNTQQKTGDSQLTIPRIEPFWGNATRRPKASAQWGALGPTAAKATGLTRSIIDWSVSLGPSSMNEYSLQRD